MVSSITFIHSQDLEETKAPIKKYSIRKPIEIDPEKIRVITLNPEEQIRQREVRLLVIPC